MYNLTTSNSCTIDIQTKPPQNLGIDRLPKHTEKNPQTGGGMTGCLGVLNSWVTKHLLCDTVDGQNPAPLGMMVTVIPFLSHSSQGSIISNVFPVGERRISETINRSNWTWKSKDMGVSKNKGTPKCMVYNGKPYQNGWFGGTTIFGNIHVKMVNQWRSGLPICHDARTYKQIRAFKQVGNKNLRHLFSFTLPQG